MSRVKEPSPVTHIYNKSKQKKALTQVNYSDIVLKISYDMTSDPLEDYINAFDFSLNAFGEQMNNPEGSSCEDRILGDFELIYIIDGESTISIDNIEYKCSKGNMVLIPPFTKNKIFANKENPHHNYWVHFDVNPFYRHDDFIKGLVGKNNFVVNTGIVDELISLYLNLKVELEGKKPGYKVITSAILNQIVVTVIRNLAAENLDYIQGFNFGKMRHSREKVIVDRSIEFIRENIKSNCNLADLSKHLKFSEAYLYKCFAKVLKNSPAQTMNLVKVKYAEQLIKTTNLTLKEIAEEVGFSTPFYLSAVFKKFYGQSPREYKRRCI